MNINVSKGSWKFERKGSHTFCVARANIRVWEDDSEALRLIDLKASGVAVCNDKDEYNYDFGKALAQSRADKRLDRKIEKFLVKLSEKNGKADIYKTDKYKRLVTITNEFTTAEIDKLITDLFCGRVK